MPYPEIPQADVDTLDITLEHLKFLQDELSEIAPDEPMPSQLYDNLRDINTQLESSLGDQLVTVNGSVIIPTLDEFGHVTGIAQAQTIIEGTFTALLVQNLVDPNTELSSWVVGLQFDTGGTSFETMVEETTINYRFFAPVSRCTFSSLESDSGIEDIMPDDDDDYATEIDIALLDDAIDLGRVDDLVRQSFPNFSDLQREMYISYIRRVGSLSSRSVILASNRSTLIDGSLESAELLSIDEPQQFSGVFKDYYVSEVVDDEENTHFMLGIMCEDPDDGVMVFALINDLTSLKIK